MDQDWGDAASPAGPGLLRPRPRSLAGLDRDPAVHIVQVNLRAAVVHESFQAMAVRAAPRASEFRLDAAAQILGVDRRRRIRRDRQLDRPVYRAEIDRVRPADPIE